MQETAALGSRALGLISALTKVFPNFPMRIPLSSDMLSANRENHIVDKLALFEKVLAFRKLMVRIRKILRVKVVRQIVVVGKFLAL